MRRKTTILYLHIFSIKLLIQWKTLDYALITGVESTQLYPLVGRISAERTKGKERCPCLSFTMYFKHISSCSLCSASLDVCPFMPEGGIYEMWCEITLEIIPGRNPKDKINTTAQAGLKLELIIHLGGSRMILTSLDVTSLILTMKPSPEIRGEPFHWKSLPIHPD